MRFRKLVVSLKVYDAPGREVATLVNGIQQPGSYRVRFDGRAQPSGLSFYRLSADGKQTTRKMLLLKQPGGVQQQKGLRIS